MIDGAILLLLTFDLALLAYAVVASICSAAALGLHAQEPEAVAAKAKDLRLRCMLYYLFLLAWIVAAIWIIPHIDGVSDETLVRFMCFPSLLIIAASVYSLLRYILAKGRKAAEEIVKIRLHAVLGIAFPVFAFAVFAVVSIVC